MGTKNKVWTNHKNLIQDALDMTFDRVYYWQLLLEESSPDIEYIQRVKNTISDAIRHIYLTYM